MIKRTELEILEKAISERNFGMSDKYIIRNCPCITGDGCNSYIDDEPFCQDCTGCVLKQIVELCKKAIRTRTMVYLPIDILQLLDIQEVE